MKKSLPSPSGPIRGARWRRLLDLAHLHKGSPRPLVVFTATAAVVAAVLSGAGCDASSSSSEGGADARADAAHDVGTDTAVDAAVDAVDPKVGLGLDYDATSGGPVARYEPSSVEFTATPWPTDRLRGADGRLDLTVFPNPYDVDLLSQYLDYGARVLDGYSRNGAIYFELSAPIDAATLPSDADSMTDPLALAQLVELTPDSAGYGRRVPVVFKQITAADEDGYYLGPTVVMRPVYGYPLADAGTYCAILTRGLRDDAGRTLAPAPAFSDALDTEPSLEPLRRWLPTSPLARRDVAVATCFTTQDATSEMRRIQAFLDERPSSALFEVTATGQTSHAREVQAKYLAPNFQAGDKPYLNEGGDVRFDSDGAPIVQLEETIRVRLLIPRGHAMPAQGWPVVLYSHGTGGDWSSCLDPVAEVAAEEGIATLCIDQPLHGIRGVGGDVELNSFNFLNPASARTSFRQAAADTVWLTHLIADGRFDLPASQAGTAEDVRLDPDAISFFGHSHGGLAGIIVLGVDPRVRAAVLSGSAGVMALTILHRKQPADIQALLAAVAGIPTATLDSFHPVVTMVQLLVDATDPVNYAPYWFSPVTGGDAKQVYMTSAVDDPDSPSVGAAAVAAAAGIPLVEPVLLASRAHELRGLAPLSLPVTSNVVAASGQVVTGALQQAAAGGHFVAFHDPGILANWRGFLRTARGAAAPVIGP